MPTPSNLSRRGVLGLAAAGALATSLSACSKNSTTDDPSGSSRPGASANSAGTFPQTVKSVYGDVTVNKQPKRLVVLNDAHADICVALGVQPVAVATDAKDLAAWAKDRFTGTLDGSLMPAFGEPSMERIASYRPDLIVGGSYSMKKDKYAQSGKIAPGYFGRQVGTENWMHLVEDLSLLLTGSAAKGEEVKKQVEDAMAPYKSRLKGLQGKTYEWVAAGDSITFGGGSAFESLGLVPAANQDGTSQNDLSYENVSQLNADVLAIFPRDASGRKKLEADPRFAQLPASKNGTVIWADVDQAVAMQSSCPSTFTYIAEWVTPTFEKSALNTKG